MNWFKKVFSLQQVNETKVVYEKSKSESENKEDKKEGEEETVTVSELKIDETQESIRSSSQNNWWNTWRGLSTQFNSSQKRELHDNKLHDNYRMKKGGAPFAVKRPKMNCCFPVKRIKKIHHKQLQLNQKTYQHKLALIKAIM